MKIMRLKKLCFIVVFISFFVSFSNIYNSLSFATTVDIFQFKELCEISTSGRTDDIEFVDDFCFVFDFEKGFMSYDITNPEEPILLDTLAFSNSVDSQVKGGHDFIIKENIAIVDYMHAGIKFVNISDPNELLVIGGYYNELKEYFRIDCWGNKIYCTQAESGLEVFEFFENCTINSIGSYSIGNTISHIQCFQEDLVYIADYDRSSEILLNVSDPENIIEIKVFDWMASNTLFQNDLMYATIIRPDNEGLRIYNNSNPLNPDLLGELKGFEGFSPLIEDNYLYLTGTQGLQIIDIADSSNPYQIAQYFDEEISYLSLAKKDNILGLVDFEDNWYLIQIESSNATGNTNISSLSFTYSIVNSILILFFRLKTNRKKSRKKNL